MNEKVIHSGKTKYSWVSYEPVGSDKKKNIQVIEWPNGEGFTIIRDNESTVEFDWCEWDALKVAIKDISQ